MQLLPAIDLRGGQVVRLYQGDYDRMTVYSADPCAVARGFIEAGASNLHVVDLDGARDGAPANFSTIAALAQLGLRVQVGGGIRTRERIEQYLALGVERVILGTVAVEDFDFTARMARDFPGRIAVGVDMKDGMAATHGWRQVSDLDGVALCRRFASAGVRTVICTDISRDGAQKGTNLALYQKLCAIPGLRVIASGGVGSIAELKALAAMGAWGAILGKALYTGQLSLAEAVQAIRTEEQP